MATKNYQQVADELTEYLLSVGLEGSVQLMNVPVRKHKKYNVTLTRMSESDLLQLFQLWDEHSWPLTEEREKELLNRAKETGCTIGCTIQQIVAEETIL